MALRPRVVQLKSVGVKNYCHTSTDKITYKYIKLCMQTKNRKSWEFFESYNFKNQIFFRIISFNFLVVNIPSKL